MKYRRQEGSVIAKESGGVIVDGAGNAHFRCPCGKRPVYVTSPPHGIDFDADGHLSLEGSCGYNAYGDPEDKENYRPRNWCHFSVSGGLFMMHRDSGCPGKDMGR